MSFSKALKKTISQDEVRAHLNKLKVSKDPDEARRQFNTAFLKVTQGKKLKD